MLEQHRRLPRRNPRQRRRHVKQVAFVNFWQKLTAHFAERPHDGENRQQRHQQGELRPFQYLQQQRVVNRNQEAVQRIARFRRDLTFDPKAHQDRDHHDCQRRRPRHGVGFGKRQRTKQAPFLPFEGEDRDKRQRDNQQADKQRRPHFHRRIGDLFPAGSVIHRFIRMRLLPVFEPLVGIFDHHDRRIHHRADGNGDPSQRHDVGVQPLEMHHDKGDAQAQRQRDDRHQRRAHVPEEQRADHRHHDKLFNQLRAQVVDGPVNQLAAVVGGDHLNPFRQAFLQRGELLFHRRNHFTGVLTRAQQHHAARHFTLAVHFSDTAAHFRADLHPRHVFQVDRYAVRFGLQDDMVKVLQAFEIAGGAYHIFRFGHLHR